MSNDNDAKVAQILADVERIRKLLRDSDAMAGAAKIAAIYPRKKPQNTSEIVAPGDANDESHG